MKIIKSSDLNWILNKKEDVWIGLNSKLEPDNRLGISHAKLEPNQELKTHYHNRPDNGHEAVTNRVRVGQFSTVDNTDLSPPANCRLPDG